MIISYPASLSRIIVLLKTLQHIIENLKKKVKDRNAARGKAEKRLSIKCNNQKRPRQPSDVLQRFWSKLNEFN